MKALVLAGGTGSRLRPLTYAMPKQLIPVAGRAVLEHCVEAIRALGVREVGVIVGDHADQIRGALGDGSRLGVRITYIHQDRPAGLAHCVLLAREFLDGDDFVMYLGDNILVGDLASAAEQFRAERPAARLLVTKVRDPSSYGVVELGADDTVLSVVEKAAQPPSDLAIIGVYFFTNAIVGAARRIRPSSRGELEITDAIAELIAAGLPVVAGRFTGVWKDTGTVEDLLECNRLLLPDLPARIDGEIDAASELRGTVVVEPGAIVVRSVIQGPALIGAGSFVTDSRIGPATAIGADCTVADAGVTDSILMNGASVRGLAAVTGSLIGRDAELESTAQTATHRLLLGDRCRVELTSGPAR